MRYTIQGADCRLSVAVYNESATKTLVVLHGMRDHGGSFESLLPVLSDFRVIIPDLRGHGLSDQNGVYTMMHFAADLLQVFDAFEVQEGYLLGHSLGGHVAARFAALFGHRLKGLILVDGFGPPRQDARLPVDQFALMQAAQVQALQQAGPRRKIMADETVAVARYQASNPGLDRAVVARLVRQGVGPAPEGGVSWRWDPRVQMVWSTFSHEDSEALLGNISCPTCVITGSEGLGYWLSMHPQLAGQQRLYEQELARRVGLIADAQSIVLKGAGHMVHYDTPEAFNQVVLDFLRPLTP
ncbi:MAG: alpha/beta hydrolase [Gammaproteobacteria bacterium]|nr:alpha/beta hydrolase [Gammaproteobacteria bacterium]MBT5054432.1 alpha/beta hydrolase [Gammaproteobacteria bacterium]MDC0464599.1 alpha/beta hydrolase [Pseudomonadales bacterium]